MYCELTGLCSLLNRQYAVHELFGRGQLLLAIARSRLRRADGRAPLRRVSGEMGLDVGKWPARLDRLERNEKKVVQTTKKFWTYLRKSAGMTANETERCSQDFCGDVGRQTRRFSAFTYLELHACFLWKEKLAFSIFSVFAVRT